MRNIQEHVFNCPEEGVRIACMALCDTVLRPGTAHFYNPGYDAVSVLSLLQDPKRRQEEAVRIKDFAKAHGKTGEAQGRCMRFFGTMLPGYKEPVVMTVTYI